MQWTGILSRGVAILLVALCHGNSHNEAEFVIPWTPSGNLMETKTNTMHYFNAA